LKVVYAAEGEVGGDEGCGRLSMDMVAVAMSDDEDDKR
jgi:hypothetical protein